MRIEIKKKTPRCLARNEDIGVPQLGDPVCTYVASVISNAMSMVRMGITNLLAASMPALEEVYMPNTNNASP